MRTEEGLLLLSCEGRILWANLAASALLGYPADELVRMALPLIVGGPCDVFTPGPIANGFNSILAGATRESEGDARFSEKDGRRVAVHFKLWLMPGGEQRQILLSLSQTAQASSDGPITAGYRDTVEYAVEGIFRSTFEGKFLEVNPALARMFGYKNAAEFMSSVMDIESQMYLQANRRTDFLALMRESDLVAGLESEVRRADGSTFWIAEFARTVRDADRQPLYFEGSVIDITERKLAESALKRSEEKFRSLAETTHVIPFEYDTRSKAFVYLGPQAEALFGRTFPDGLSLVDWMAMVHPDDQEAGASFARGDGRGEAHDFQMEFRVRAGDGKILWVKQIVHCATAGDDLHSVRGFLFDVSKTKREEEEREVSRQQLRELAARSQEVREDERVSIAREIHDELGQALTILKIDLTWMGNHLSETVPDHLQNPFEAKIGKMQQLIHGTLQAVRRIISALRPPLLEELGLKDAIEFQMQEFSKRVGIRYELHAEPVKALRGNSLNAVFRIFQESLTNVARHAKASRIKVSLRQADSHVLMRVEDNGCGISKDRLNRSKNFGLLGMRERAWAIGGELDINATPGAGTVVTLKVPLDSQASRF